MTPDCLSDLVARSRRYRLSRDEQRQLDAHLSSCASCRLAQQVGADFDAIGGLQARDDVLIATLADRIVDRRHGARVGRTRTRLVAAAAAVACALFAAAAGAYAVYEQRVSVTAPAQGGHALATRAAAPPAEQIELLANAAIREPRLDAPAPAREQRVRTRSRSRAPEPTAPVESASSLFASANGERRRSHAVEAISLYDELERLYPESPEAHVSRVSLGRLLLARGMWPEALAQLGDYLTASPDGTLAPEALFGKARALQALGRKDEERGTWERLLAKFPDSVYAAQASRRIQELR